MAYNNILVALSCTGDETAVLDEAVRLKNTLKANLSAVHVNDPHAGELSMMIEGRGHKYEESEIRDIFNKAGHEEIASTIEVKIFTGNSVTKEITAITEGIDLLVVGHQKVSGIVERLKDTIDERIVNHVKCPVLVVPKL
ncbi:universal stress protein [Candidatus Neomarinimicrobiota bacterium]